MRFIDVHAHMWELNGDEMRVWEKCKQEGISVINCGVDEQTNQIVLNSPYYKSLGWWPGYKSDFAVIEKQVRENKLVAIGEVGLDYHWNKKSEKLISQFKKMLSLAEEFNLPVIVHSRDAHQDVFDVLKNFSVQVDLHAFSGNKKLINEGVDRGYYFSVPTVLLRSSNFQKLVEIVPAEQLLTESDTPYLGVERPNTPLTIPLIVNKMGEIKGVNMERQVLFNAKKLFGI